jgi:thioredoxin reductase (NADPH)
MSRPVIMIVGDEPGARAGLLAALTRRFGADYHVVSHGSAGAALEHLGRIKSDGVEVALIIASQPIPEMDGRELLARAHEIDRGAKRALLVRWGDRGSSETILQGCAFGQLDNYLIKPWAPPEVHLYPLVSEFLAEWTRAYGPPTEMVQIIGELPSRRSHELQDLLQRSGIRHGAYDARSEQGRVLLEQARQSGQLGPADAAALPVVMLLDGRALSAPSNTELSDALGASDLAQRSCDLLVIGAGPAGLAAAVYAASEGLRTVVVEREAVGGQAGTSSLIRNYLGFPRGISGAELAQRAYQQAWLFGAKYAFAREVRGLRADGGERVITLSDGREIAAGAVVIASGAQYRRIDAPRLERFVGMGVYYAAIAEDTRPIRGHDVYVVGGGNSAGQAVVHLAKNARRVTLLVRGASLGERMSDYLIQQIEHLRNVEVRLRTQVTGGDGAHALEHITLYDEARHTTEVVPAEMLFVLVGAQPHAAWLGDAVVRDQHGFILTGRDLPPQASGADPRPFETSLSGVFAIGDVRSGSVKRVASAVGEGTVAMHFVQQYLAERTAR